MKRSEIDVGYAHMNSLSVFSKRVISTEAHQLFPGSAINLVEDETSSLLSPDAIYDYPRSELFVRSQIMRQHDILPEFPETYLFLDIETHNAEKRWDIPLKDFFRLGQYAWGEGPVQLTEDLDVVLGMIEQADKVIAHNGHSFDFSVLLGDDALDLAFEGKLFDTYTFAKLKHPCPITYTHANGTTYRNNTSPQQYRRWYGLDNLAYQFGASRKFGDLAKLAAKYNPKGTPRSELDFGLIPVDDADFLEYAKQDIIALRELTRSMLAVTNVDDYDRRTQITDAIDAQMTRNGVKVDVALAQERIDQAEKVKQDLLVQLENQYNFPTKGKMPWRTKAGKEAIEKLLSDAGIDIHSASWPKTATGNPSLGGDALLAGTQGTSAESLGVSLAELQGQRPLAAQALQYTNSDGVMHPDIDGLQRSGRRSVSQAGLTTWGSRTEAGVREKEYFVAKPGHMMLECDLSNADARAVAFMSGDKNRAKWFEPGADSHEIVGRLMFGDDVYDSDPGKYRNISKPLNHGAAYGAGAKKLSASAKVELSDAERFLDVMQAHYPDVIRWQNHVREEGVSGWLTNHWGRTMPVESDRAYTQAPALMGQSSTTEVLYDGLINLYAANRDYIQYVLFPVHDAIVCDVPEDEIEDFTKVLVGSFYQVINGIEFTLGVGNPGKNWADAMHG